MLPVQKMTMKITGQYGKEIVSIQIQLIFSANRKGERESWNDSALFFPKALNAKFCLAGLLTYPGF